VRIANQGGVGLSARGFSAGLSINYQSGGPGRDDDMRLYYYPLDGDSEETTGAEVR
jgi:hypothetical protein